MPCKKCGQDSKNPWSGIDEYLCESCLKNKDSNSNRKKIVFSGIAIFMIYVAVFGGSEIKPSDSEIRACKELIWEHNRYEPSRMKYRGFKHGVIEFDYTTPTYGKYWKLRCKGDTPQVWASGASMWVDI